MDQAIYTLMNSANQVMNSQKRMVHNLANADTVGFRADLEHVQSVDITGGVFNTRVHVATQEGLADFNPGALINTGRDLDVAIEDQGWFVVADEEGQEFYTRAGNFEVNELGQLVTPTGYYVIGDGGPITLPAYKSIQIANDGTLSIQPVGQDATTIAAFVRLKLVNPPKETLAKGAEGYFRRIDGITESDADISVTVQHRSLENSNVNPISTLVGIMSASRQYQMHFKMMQNMKEIASHTAQLMNLKQ